MGSGFWGGMSSFKPGWLCGSDLDNTQGFFVRVDVDSKVVIDVGRDDIIPISMVCGTGVSDLWEVGFGVEVLSGMALGMGNRIVGVSSFLRNQ